MKQKKNQKQNRKQFCIGLHPYARGRTIYTAGQFNVLFINGQIKIKINGYGR